MLVFTTLLFPKGKVAVQPTSSSSNEPGVVTKRITSEEETGTPSKPTTSATESHDYTYITDETLVTDTIDSGFSSTRLSEQNDHIELLVIE